MIFGAISSPDGVLTYDDPRDVLVRFIEEHPDAVIVDGSTAQSALSRLGFYTRTQYSQISSAEEIGREWDQETIGAFHAWATSRGLPYEITPDPAPLFPELPNTYMIVMPKDTWAALLLEAGEIPAAAVSEEVTIGESGIHALGEPITVESPMTPVVVIVIGALGLGGLAWAIGSSAKKGKLSGARIRPKSRSRTKRACDCTVTKY